MAVHDGQVSLKKRGLQFAIDKDEQEIEARATSIKIILQLLVTRFASDQCSQYRREAARCPQWNELPFSLQTRNWFHWRLRCELTLMGKPSEVFRADVRLSGRTDPPAWAWKGGTLWNSSLQLPKVSPPSQGASSGYGQEVSMPGTAPAFSCLSSLCRSNPSHPKTGSPITGASLERRIKTGSNCQLAVMIDLPSHEGKRCQHSPCASKENKL